MQRGPERLVVVAAVPIAHELLEGLETAVRRLLEVDREPARTQQAARLGEDARQRLGRGLVQHHRRVDEVGAAVGQRGRGRVLLPELDVLDAQRTGSRVAIAQEGRGDIERDDARRREGAAQRQRVVAEAAAEIDDHARLEVRVLALEPGGERAAGGVVPGTGAAAHGGEEARVVVGGVGDIVLDALGRVAAAHQVGVHRRDITRHIERRVEVQCRRVGVELAGAVAQRLGLTADQLPTGVLAHLHGVAAHQAPGAPGGVARHGLGHLAAVTRLVAVAHAESLPGLALVGIAHRRGQPGRQEGVELRHHIEARGLVVARLGSEGVPADLGPWSGRGHGSHPMQPARFRKIDYS